MVIELTDKLTLNEVEEFYNKYELSSIFSDSDVQLDEEIIAQDYLMLIQMVYKTDKPKKAQLIPGKVLLVMLDDAEYDLGVLTDSEDRLPKALKYEITQKFGKDVSIENVETYLNEKIKTCWK